MRRLNTKQARLDLLAYEFDRMDKRNFARENYQDLVIFTGFENGKFYLKIFAGTSTNPLCYYTYQKESERTEAIERYKKSADSRINYKAEQKAKIGFKTGAASCSAAVKSELKSIYPHIKFSVTADTFSMGDAVRIHWTDGPTTSEVENITCKYQQGHFDGMTDMYENSNSREDIPQAKYITTSRKQSEETQSKLIELVSQIYAINNWGCHSVENLAYRLFYATSFPKDGTIKGLEKTGETCGLCDINVFYFVSFEGNEPEPEPELIDWDTIFDEPKKSDIEILDYSEKAIAVIGNTKRLKEDFKALGGRFNFRLSCGAGWVFPTAKKDQILQLI